MSSNTNFNYIGIVPADGASGFTGLDIFRVDGALSLDTQTTQIRGTLGIDGTSESSITYQTGYGYDENDVIGIAIDCDNLQVTFYKNGVSTGTFPHQMKPDQLWMVFVNDWASGHADIDQYNLNTGQRPWAYPAPAGYRAICTHNL